MGQQLPESRWHEGFSEADPEYMIIAHQESICLRTFRGIATFDGDRGAGREGVTIELKDDSATQPVRIRRTRTNRKGEFKIRGLKDGRYIMKVILDGFQSIYRPVEISSKCSAKQDLNIELQLDL